MASQAQQHQADKIVSLASRVMSLAQRHAAATQEGGDGTTARAALCTACEELAVTITAPEAWLCQAAASSHTAAALAILLETDIITRLCETAEPVAGPTLLKDVGDNATPALFRCALRQCAASHLLDEPVPGHFQRNPRTELLHDPYIRDWIHYLVDDGLRCASWLSRYAAQNDYHIADERHRSAFGLAFDTNTPCYDYYHQLDPPRGQRFGNAMEGYFRMNAPTPIEDIIAFPAVCPEDGVVVDVGGGRGHHSLRLAQRYPRMRFIVQDYANEAPSASSIDPDPGLRERVRWIKHDFFDEQPVRGAGVYLLSHILMDHPDRESQKILEHLAEAMDARSTLLVDDFFDPGDRRFGSPQGNTLALHLIACRGTAFRTMEQWTALFARVPVLTVVECRMLEHGRVVMRVSRRDGVE
ncbi:S-adenosyl-L-methionine-dependent methyltransferase [Aspergillus japonicus CBS 114.51]|uniref:S-adenosyl-L-methionine-dependent methyltransferase n=1 Tax=Aspergillus japonicus CBS 114.51 TaxID=1448312 RepID=A0A8T8WQW7_ASPJA|nr:S-adenosyl-L-methionine-dependent methyltransferase [Aspergillus japonicus CBS 114.51]RAH78050.1 S-adenosyl-L-methionine-dependent methyltransferase [Aspergillus japonicus CBS 114.51]